MEPERRLMHFVLRDGRKATVLTTPIEYATAWRIARNTSINVSIPVEDEDGNVKELDIREFEKLRVNGFAQKRRAA